MPGRTEAPSTVTVQVTKVQPEMIPGDVLEPGARPSVVPRMGPRDTCLAKYTDFPSDLRDDKETIDCIVRSLKGQTAHLDVFAQEAEGTVMGMTMPLDHSVVEELGIDISATCSCGHTGTVSLEAKLELYVDDEQIKDRPLPTKVDMPMAALKTLIRAKRQPCAGSLIEGGSLAIAEDDGWYTRDASNREETVLARGFSAAKDTTDLEVTISAPNKRWGQKSEEDDKPQSIKVKVPHWQIRFERPTEKSYERLPLLTGPSFSTKDSDGYLIDRFPEAYEKFNRHALELLSDTEGLPFRKHPDQQGSGARYLHHLLTPHDSYRNDNLLRLTEGEIRHFTPVRIGKLVELTIPIKSEMDGISTDNLKERFGTVCLDGSSGGNTWSTVLKNQDTPLPDRPLEVSLVSWPGLAEFMNQHKEAGESNLGKAPMTMKPDTSVEGRYMSREDDTLTVYSAGNIYPEDQGLQTLVPATFMWDDADGFTHKQVKLVRMTVYDTATCHASTHWQREMLTEREVQEQRQFLSSFTRHTHCAQKGSCPHAEGA